MSNTETTVLVKCDCEEKVPEWPLQEFDDLGMDEEI